MIVRVRVSFKETYHQGIDIDNGTGIDSANDRDTDAVRDIDSETSIHIERWCEGDITNYIDID